MGTKLQVTDEPGDTQTYVSGVIMPQLGLAARALADSSSRHLIDFPRQNALKKNPESISPIYLSLPRTPSISIHFPSCCANDVWLSQSIKEDIKLYSIISPLSLRTCAFPSSVADSSKREGFRPRFRLISQGAHQSSRLTLRPVVLFQTVVQLFQEKGSSDPRDFVRREPIHQPFVSSCLCTVFAQTIGMTGPRVSQSSPITNPRIPFYDQALHPF